MDCVILSTKFFDIQKAKVKEMMVKRMATMPIFLALSSLALKYLNPHPNPNGGRKKLTR